jgi:hypothetical protein
MLALRVERPVERRLKHVGNESWLGEFQRAGRGVESHWTRIAPFSRVEGASGRSGAPKGGGDLRLSGRQQPYRKAAEIGFRRRDEAAKGGHFGRTELHLQEMRCRLHRGQPDGLGYG